MTVTLKNVLRNAPREERTTAHGHVAQFYREMFRPVQGESIVNRIARAVSPFDVEVCLHDAFLFAPGASQKAKAKWIEAAEYRLCQLAGTIYIRKGNQ